MKPVTKPLRSDEIWTRWLDLAAEENVRNPGDAADLPGVIFEVGLDETKALYEPSEVLRIHAALRGKARAGEPAYSLAWVTVSDDEPPRIAIIANPDALASNLTGLIGDFRAQAEGEHRLRVVLDAQTSGLPADVVALRWGIGKRTLWRWRAEVESAKTILAVSVDSGSIAGTLTSCQPMEPPSPISQPATPTRGPKWTRSLPGASISAPRLRSATSRS